MRRGSRIDRPKAILFDMDGVLVDSEALHWESVRDVLHDHLGDQAPELEPRVGWGDHELWEELISEYPLSGTPLSLTAEREQHAVRRLTVTPPPPMPHAFEAIELLRQLDPELKLVVVSASPKTQINLSLARWVDPTGDSLFDQYFSGIDDADHNKPNPAPYLAAMRWLGLSAEECWIAEDSSTGLRAALGSGGAVFAVAALTASQDLRAQCFQELNNLLELVQLWRATTEIDPA